MRIHIENTFEPNCAEGIRVDVPVSVKLSELFKHKGRNVLRNLDFPAVSGQDFPSGDKNMTWDVSEFAVRMNWDNQND